MIKALPPVLFFKLVYSGKVRRADLSGSLNLQTRLNCRAGYATVYGVIQTQIAMPYSTAIVFTTKLLWQFKEQQIFKAIVLCNFSIFFYSAYFAF